MVDLHRPGVPKSTARALPDGYTKNEDELSNLSSSLCDCPVMTKVMKMTKSHQQRGKQLQRRRNRSDG